MMRETGSIDAGELPPDTFEHEACCELKQKSFRAGFAQTKAMVGKMNGGVSGGSSFI